MAYNPAQSNISGKLVYLIVFIYSAFVLIRPHEYMPLLRGIPILPVLLVAGAAIWMAMGRKAFHVSQHKLIIVLLLILSLSPILQSWMGGIVIAFNKFYPIVIFYFLIVGALDSSAKVRGFYWLMVVAAVIIALHGIGQVENGVGWSGAMPVMGSRITYVGIFNDPNDIGNFIVATLPALVYLYGYYKSFLFRMMFLGALFTLLYGVYLTNSRGAILGIAGMLWLYLASKYGVARAVIVSLMISPVILLAPSRVSEIDPNEESAAGRVDAWYAGVEMLLGSKFLGVGYGGFVEHHHLTAHNSFVLVFAELGVIGYFIWVAFLFLSFFMAYKMLRQAMSKERSERSENEALAFPVFYSMVGFLVTAFFLSRSYNILLYMLAAISIANYINENKVVDITLSRYFGKIMMLTLGSIMFFVVVVKVLLNL